ncbi:hypothetical protein [Nocardia sp. NPDC049526]|uniref:hypothetical protein n=1 Tax=Nocardia sp. NPDC049526 TaxID=3364316 RepID=UPI00378747A7
MASVSWVRVVAPVVAAAVISTGLAVVVNLATGGGPWWLWVVVAVLTMAGIGASLWLYQRQSGTSGQRSQDSVTASGARSVAVHGNPAGSISTGDTRTLAPPTPAPPEQPPSGGQQGPSGAVEPAPGSVTASGERSVAIDGNPGGDISTGDNHGPMSA